MSQKKKKKKKKESKVKAPVRPHSRQVKPEQSHSPSYSGFWPRQVDDLNPETCGQHYKTVSEKKEKIFLKLLGNRIKGRRNEKHK